MAATYEAQLRKAYRWAEIVAAIDNAVGIVRDWFVEVDGHLGELVALMPTDGWTISNHGISINVSIDEDDEQIVSSIYIGRPYRDSPSGSFYAPWSSVRESLRDKDARWWDAFERVANANGVTISQGEGDPTDGYITRYDPLVDDSVERASYPDDIGAK